MREVSIRCDSREDAPGMVGSQWVVFVNNDLSVCWGMGARAHWLFRTSTAVERQGLGMTPQQPLIVYH